MKNILKADPRLMLGSKISCLILSYTSKAELGKKIWENYTSYDYLSRPDPF